MDTQYPPEPEMVEVRCDPFYVRSDGLATAYWHSDKRYLAYVKITGTIPKLAPGEPLVTYRAPILTDERRDALRYIRDFIRCRNDKSAGTMNALTTLRDMLGEGE